MKIVAMLTGLLTAAVAAVPVAAIELAPLPALPLAGHAYPGVGEPAEIRFINTRVEPVRVQWIGLDGAPRSYATLAPGEEYLQATFTTHRWMITRVDGSPLSAFIATQGLAVSSTPIALIR